MTSQRGSRVRIPPSPLKAEAVISLGFSRRRRDHPFSFFSSAESISSVAPLHRWRYQVLPLRALHRSPPFPQRVPICTGGSQTSSQSSYAQENPLQACSDSHRRNVGALALLLCRWKPSPRVFRPAQEERGRLCSPPTHHTPPAQERRVESRRSRLGFPINEQNGQFCSG